VVLFHCTDETCAQAIDRHSFHESAVRDYEGKVCLSASKLGAESSAHRFGWYVSLELADAICERHSDGLDYGSAAIACYVVPVDVVNAARPFTLERDDLGVAQLD